MSERTRSRMLKLEKENQSLLRSIEELRAASINNSAQPKHGHHLQCEHVCQVVCTTDEPTGLQTTCSHIENRTNVFPLSTVTQQMLNGGSHCHQPLHAEDELEGVQSEILLTENPDLHMKEKGQLEDGDHFKELMSDLDVLENNHNRLHCFVGSRDSSPGSKSSSPCHDSIFTGLPTRSSYASKHTQRLEAKCRALDTVNQHLQTSLDNTGRFCRLNQHLRISDASIKLLRFLLPTLHLFRPESSAPGGRGSGAGGREPESAGHFRRTSDLCTAPGATGNREAKPGARNHSPGEGKEAARERESTTPPAGK